MLKISTICLHADDWQRAIGFWAAALDRSAHPQAADVLVDSDGGPNLGLYRDANHLDLSIGADGDQQAEVERLMALGASRVDDWPYPPDADFVVMRDTEGNLFCILDH